MYRNFYSINDMPKPIRCDENIPEKPKKCEPTSPDTTHKKSGGLLSNLQIDDIILIAIILILLADGCDDNLLILAIAFVFISGM